MTTPDTPTAISRLGLEVFPSFPDDELFSNWVAELVEMDGHIVGLAKQVESGQQIDKRKLQVQMAELRRSFDKLAVSNLNETDERIHQQCRNYIVLMEEAVRAMATRNR